MNIKKTMMASIPKRNIAMIFPISCIDFIGCLIR